jgi:hypothetical protein
MALLRNQTQKAYYQGDDLGNYQFTKLIDIINQFMFAYVGENKIIPKISRADIAFHAQRAMQELSFDTFKSIKSHQIDIPASLKMVLPHDYVNYTKISWADTSGIKHPIYPTKHTNNPFEIRQKDDGTYYFEGGDNLLKNFDFTADNLTTNNSWQIAGPGSSSSWSSVRTTPVNNSGIAPQFPNYIDDEIIKESDELTFKHLWLRAGGIGSNVYCVWQKINVTNMRSIDLKATATSADRQTVTVAGDIADYGRVRIGLSITNPETGLNDDGSIGWARPQGSITGGGVDLSGTAITAYQTNPFSSAHPAPHFSNDIFIPGSMVEWNDGTTSEKSQIDIDVSDYNHVYVLVVSNVPFTQAATEVPSGVGSATVTPTSATYTTKSVNSVNQVSITTAYEPDTLQTENENLDSSTWNNYKNITPSENNNDDYEDDTYWPNDGMRYGLEPSHAQINGSFFIDQRLGNIHFSSNISGKTVILDYISDGLGTEEEMMVHKFAEEAVYKHILCGIMSTRANVGRNQLAYYKKDKFAATRLAKLRLSNIKIEELTQILRGKSKWIKH